MEYTPEVAGSYTVVVALRTASEEMVITSSFDDAAQARGGTFTLYHQGDATQPIAWDASADVVERRLEGLPSIGTVDVSRSEVAAGFVYTVGFVDAIGDVELLTVDDSALVEGTVDIAESDGASAHIRTDHQGETTSLIPEVQVVQSSHDVDACSGTFTLAFRGAETAGIACQSTGDALKESLEALETVGQVTVTASDSNRRWHITFEGLTSAGNVFPSNVGDLPLMTVSDDTTSTGGGSVVVNADDGVQGWSPFMGVAVVPTSTSAAHSTAVDSNDENILKPGRRAVGAGHCGTHSAVPGALHN